MTLTPFSPISADHAARARSSEFAVVLAYLQPRQLELVVPKGGESINIVTTDLLEEI